MGKYIVLIIAIVLVLPQVYYLIKAKTYKDKRNGTKYFLKESKKIEGNHSRLTLTNTDGFDISCNLYDVEEPKALVQIIHGVYEHSANYQDFIKYLNDRGYAVIASDNRGHGRSVSEKYPSGYLGNLEELIDDQVVINKFMRTLYSDKAVYMVGHSFGSILARLYLREHDTSVDKVLLTGTVAYVPVAGLGVFLGNIITFYLGEYRKSKILDKLTGVADPDISWISYSQENIRIKANDPMRLGGFLARANVVLIDSNLKLHQFSKFKAKNKNLEILSLTGEDDMVVMGEKGLNDSIESLQKVGYDKVQYKVYPHMKHEVLCEDKKEEVYEDALRFFEESLV